MLDAAYNRIAGRSTERLAALSDGIFAVAMTLLVLDLHVPLAAAIHSDRDLLHAMAELALRLLVYVMSFLTLGIFWVLQQTQLNHVERSDRDLSWMHLAFLLTVTLIPFSTSLLAEFTSRRIALLSYWANILAMGVALYASWRYVTRNCLVKADISAEATVAIRRRMLMGQSLYAFGALLCAFNTYWSIAFIVLVQLNYAIAPGSRRKH